MDARRGLSCIRATSLPHNDLPQDVSHIQQTPPAVGSRDHAGENLSGRGQLLQAVRLDRQPGVSSGPSAIAQVQQEAYIGVQSAELAQPFDVLLGRDALEPQGVDLLAEARVRRALFGPDELACEADRRKL